MMQTWLRDRGQPVPEATATRMRMTMNGMEHDMLMPGMLTDEQMAELDKARGAEFDRLFLTAMIKHHQGAITMVDELIRLVRRRAGRRDLQVRVRRRRRSVDRDRAHAEDARGRGPQA